MFEYDVRPKKKKGYLYRLNKYLFIYFFVPQMFPQTNRSTWLAAFNCSKGHVFVTLLG